MFVVGQDDRYFCVMSGRRSKRDPILRTVMKPDTLIDIIDPIDIVSGLRFRAQRFFDFLQRFFADAAAIIDNLDDKLISTPE